MDKEIMDKVFSYIDAIAAKLGVASEYVFGLLVKQAFINGLTNLIITVSLIVIFVILLIVGFKKWEETDCDGDSIFIGLIVISAFVAIVSFVVFVIAGADWIGKLINPQYYALKEIMNMFKK